MGFDNAMYDTYATRTVQRHRQGGGGRERGLGATHTHNADRDRAKQRDGTDPNTGQNRGQSTPGSGQEQP